MHRTALSHLLIALAAILSIAAPAAAQRTVVTGTVTDPNGLPYSGGTISAQLTLPVGASGATLNGVQISGTSPATSLDANGSFLFQLPDNNVVLPAGTKWTFSVAIAPGVPPPMGFGPRAFVAGPITITGASQDVSATLSAAAPALSRIVAGTGFSNVTDPTAFGVTSNGVGCFGSNSTITVTSGSNQVSCSIATYTAADLGKYIEATNGAGGVGAQIGSLVGIKGTITAIISSTTVQVSNNATANISGANAFLGWGTLDDNAWDLAEAALNSKLRCGGIVIPVGWSFISRQHLNTLGTGCSGQTTTVSYDNEIFGWGPGVSILFPTADFDFTTCTFLPTGVSVGGIGCFFSIPQITVRDVGIFGGANSLTGTTHANVLVQPGLGSQFYNVSFSGFGASSTSLVGFQYANGTRSWGLSSDGFGIIGCNASPGGANAYAMWHFCGDNAGPNLQLASSGTFFDYGGQYGTTTGTAMVTFTTSGVKYVGIGSSNFGSTGTNGTLFLMSNNLNSEVVLIGARWNNTGITTNGIFSNDASQIIRLVSSTIGGTSAAISRTAASTVYISDDSKLLGTIGTSLRPTLATSGNGTIAFSGTGAALNEHGQFTLTAGTTSGATPTVTITFAGTPTGPGGGAPRCDLTLLNGTVDGVAFTGAWNARFSDAVTALSTAAVTYTIDNNAVALTNGSTYGGQYSCRFQ